MTPKSSSPLWSSLPPCVQSLAQDTPWVPHRELQPRTHPSFPAAPALPRAPPSARRPLFLAPSRGAAFPSSDRVLSVPLVWTKLPEPGPGTATAASGLGVQRRLRPAPFSSTPSIPVPVSSTGTSSRVPGSRHQSCLGRHAPSPEPRGRHSGGSGQTFPYFTPKEMLTLRPPGPRPASCSHTSPSCSDSSDTQRTRSGPS